MRFLAIYTPDPSRTHQQPSPEDMAAMDQFVQESLRNGWVLATGGMLPLSKGARLTASGGEITVTDGPYTEAKEVVAGYALLQARSKEEAIANCKRFLKLAGDGVSELYPLLEPGDGCSKP